MASEGASAVLQSDKTLKDDALVSLSWVLRPLPPAPASLQRPHGKPLPPPSRNALLPLQKPLEFSPFPRTPMIAVYRGCGLKKAGPFNFSAHTRAAERLVEPLLTHSIVLNEVPLIRGVPRVLQRGVQRPTRLLLSAPPLSTFLPAPAGRRSCANDDQMWPQGLCPPAIPPVPPTMPGVNKVPPPHWACGEGGLDILQPKALPDDTCRSASLYENFRHWQHFKTLLRRLLPLTPDVEAVSCFLVSLLWSLSHQHPTLSVEEGLGIGVRKWGRMSHYERMAFYKVAEGFMRFEAAEEIEDPMLLSMRKLPDCPPPAPLRLDPPRSPDAVQQPVSIPRQTESKAQAACPPAHKCQQSRETQVPADIPADTVKECIDTMDWLEDRHLLATVQPEENQEKEQQEEDEMYPDPGLLSYCDEFCSQEDSVSKVEAAINPQFLVEAKSAEMEKDTILAVGQVLEEEHGLTPEQLVEKRLLGSKAQGDDREPKQRVSKEACAPPKASQVLKRCRAIDEDLPVSKVLAVLPRQQSPAPLGTSRHNTLPQDLAPQCALGLREASPTQRPCKPVSCLDEDKGDFSSLSFLLASPHQLLPWGLLQTLGPDTGLFYPDGPAPQTSPPQGGGLSPGLPSPARSKKRVLLGGSAPVGKRSRPGPSYEVSGGQDLTQGPVPPSGPQKGRCNKLGSQRQRKRH